MGNHVSKKTEDFIQCKRCNENNWDNPKFWGCPRGSCEVEVNGEIVTTKLLKLNY